MTHRSPLFTDFRGDKRRRKSQPQEIRMKPGECAGKVVPQESGNGHLSEILLRSRVKLVQKCVPWTGQHGGFQ